MSLDNKLPEIYETAPPGSDKAVNDGCTCPRMDNHYGAGRGGEASRYGWYVHGDCFLHAENPKAVGGR